MRTSLLLRSLCLVGVVLLHAGCSSLVADTSPEADHATLAMRANPDRYILVTVENEPTAMQTRAGSTTRGYDTAVRYKVSSRARATAQSLSSTYQLREVRSWPIPALRVHCIVFELPGGAEREAVLTQLRREPSVRVAQPLHTFATTSSSAAYNDPYLDLQRSLQQMAIPAAHRWSRGRGVRVALIDTGVDTHHPDLAGRISESRNFIDADEKSFERDRHGTSVAGLIAALAGNSEGIVGVAPEVALIALKACWQLDPASDAAVCNSFTLAQGLDAAIDARAQVINLSIGSFLPNTATAIEQGITSLHAYSWFGFFGPAGTPKPIVDRFYDDVVAAVREDAIYNTFVNKFRSEVPLPSPAELRRMIVEELPFWGKIIRDNHIKAGSG